MSGTFFISSNGSMATQWLATILSASPQVRCFHGVAGLLPNPLRPDLNVVFDKLRSIATEEKVYAGSVHVEGGHGLDALEAVRQRKFVFLALLRNPIQVISSQYEEKIREIDAERDPLYKQRSADFLSIIGRDSFTTPEAIFTHCTASAVKHYLECCAAPDELLFHFENYTTDYAEICRMLSTATRGALTDDPAIRTAFETVGVLNIHRPRKRSWEEIYHHDWPAEYRRIFRAIYQHFRKQLPETLQSKRHYPMIAELSENA